MTLTGGPLRVGFVLHVMQVAGAEVLVAAIIRRLGQKIAPVVLCLDGIGQLGEQMRKEGVPVLELQRKPGFDRGLPGRVARAIEHHNLEVIHAHQYTPFFYSALAKPLVRQPISVMFTEHGRHFPDVVSTKRRLVNRFVLSRFADEINGVSQFSVGSLAAVDGFESQPLAVIPNGIDPDGYAQITREDAKARLGLELGRRYVSCVARFHPIKDHAMLLRAFAVVASQVADVDLLLAGDGPLRSELEAQTAALGLASRVHFLGVRRDIPDILRASAAFALTSINEAASITLLEAMASEVPVVVTRVGGNPELVDEGEQGLLVPRGDASAAASALLTLLADPELATRMGKSGRARVCDRYQLDVSVLTYYERYRAAATTLRARAGTAHRVPA